MKKLIMVSFICGLMAMLMAKSAFAEPYKGKTFPEKQVVKWYCVKFGGTDCSYLGKFKQGGETDYNVYFWKK